jgi:hypothetical protein
MDELAPPAERHFALCSSLPGSPWSFCVSFQIDGALYPDVEVPERLDSLASRIDFLARLCAAWDFGLLPDWDTIVAIRQPEWRPAVEACALLTSPTYHLLRGWHGLAPRPYLGSIPAYIRDDPFLSQV